MRKLPFCVPGGQLSTKPRAAEAIFRARKASGGNRGFPVIADGGSRADDLTMKRRTRPAIRHARSRSRGLAARAPLRGAMVALPDVQVLDVTGPLEVFGGTARGLVEAGRQARPFYQVELLAAQPGPLVTSSGLVLQATRSFASVSSGIDTLLVA